MLTPRERAVARYYAMGLSPWRIGKAVHARPETVRKVLVQENVREHVPKLLDAQDELAINLVATTFFRAKTELRTPDMRRLKNLSARHK